MASPLVIASMRGGINTTDPAIALAADQSPDLANIEWIASTLGERRRGTVAIDLSGSGLTSETGVYWLFRHLPSNDETAAELWGLAATGASTKTLARKDTSWHGVTVADAMNLASGTQYQLSAVSLHGKLFLAYKSSVDRLHVWDGTTFRRVGMSAPGAAPTLANNGSGTYTGIRYFRIRWTVMDFSSGTGVVLRRSEPSAMATITPSGTGGGVQVTRPTDDSDSATHWELEGSTDNVNFFLAQSPIAIATTAVVDTTPYAIGYGGNWSTLVGGGALSADIEDYSLIGSARYVLADEDRLLWAGSYENPALDSTFGWTPVYSGPGAGNDERIELDTDPTLGLDGFEGGRITGMGGPVNGLVYLFKRDHIYRAARTGNRSAAYQVICVTKVRGAIEGSILNGLDEAGRPCVYFLDSQVGPCRIGVNGLQWLGADLYTTWKSVNLTATIPARAVYYAAARQVHFWVATGASVTPNVRLVLHTDLTVSDDRGNVRRGWSLWTGAASSVTAACLVSDNIDAGTARNFNLRPCLGIANGVHRGDTGNDDSGTAYSAYLTTRPMTPASLLNKFGVMAGALLAKAAGGVSVVVSAVRDFGLESVSVTADLTPTATEPLVIKALDNLALSESKAMQITISDPAMPGGRWELHQIALKPRGEQTA